MLYSTQDWTLSQYLKLCRTWTGHQGALSHCQDPEEKWVTKRIYTVLPVHIFMVTEYSYSIYSLKLLILFSCFWFFYSCLFFVNHFVGWVHYDTSYSNCFLIPLPFTYSSSTAVQRVHVLFFWGFLKASPNTDSQGVLSSCFYYLCLFVHT